MANRGKSRSAQANTNEDAPSNFLKDNAKRLRTRSSSFASRNDAVPNIQQDSYSNVYENIYENEAVTPRKKKTNTSKNTRRLKDNEIAQDLEESDDDNSTSENSSTGAKEEPKNNERSKGTSHKLRRTVGNINYNEEALMEKHQEDCINKIKAATLSRTHKNNKSQASKQAVDVSPRKRSNENTLQEFDGYGVDENKMSQANQITSPPKRSKSEMEIEQTPKKNSIAVDLKGTPRSAAKRKMNFYETANVTDSPAVNTRKKTTNGQVNYKDRSTSDDNNKKELKLQIPKIDTSKIITRKSSINHQAQESEESETENKMANANKNSTRRSTRSQKILQKPLDNLETPYSPSKELQKLNINKDEGTPKSSQKLIVRLKVPPQSTPSKSAKVQADTPRRSERNTKTIREIEQYTDEESADSSDDYKEEDDSSESEESLDSGNDSAEEFHQLRKSRRTAPTPRKTTATPKTNKRISKVSMDTPTKAISRMSLGTPTLDKHRRTFNISKPSTPLQKARATLHVSVLPKSLPCREEQFNDIYSFLHARLSDGSGGCIYISGVPGTGKTATVSEVIRCLKKSMTKGELPEFDYIEINGMKLSEPRQAYVQIWRQMTGETKTWEESHKLLQAKFNSSSKRHMTLLLVDELDLLCTKRQDVVYNLLDWPSKAHAKLVVVTIANTMDLPERILMGKVTSRLGLTRLTFPPYNFKQLEEIVVSRLKGANAFGGETIQLVARKVAAVSGDARRALDICRRSAEIAEKAGRQLVNMSDVKQALDEMIASPKIQAIKHCSDMEKYFLQAVCTEVNRTGVEEVVFKNVYMQMEPLCALDGIKAPNISEALEMCARLGSWRLLLCDHSRMDIHQRLLLNVSTDDVYFATRNIDA